MTDYRGQAFNVSSIPVTPVAIPVGSVTAVTLIPAPPSLDKPWRWISIHSTGNKELWIRFYGATDDALKRGTVILPSCPPFIMQLPNMQSLEVSGIFEAGGLRDVFVQYF